MLTRDQAIAEIRAGRYDPERLATLALPDDPDVRRYLFDVCSLDTLTQALFERTKDRDHWARFRIETFALGGMVLASKEMCDWDRTRHEWALRPGRRGVEIWEEEAKGKYWAEEHYEAPRKALEAKEKWLRGEIGDEELSKARDVDEGAVSLDVAFASDAAFYAASATYYVTSASTPEVADVAYATASAAAAAVYADADYYAAYPTERDRWYLDYLGCLLESCNKELLR